MKQETITYKNTQKITPELIEEIIHIDTTEGLTPENVVKRAHDKNNPLHNIFDWNNKTASHSWRLQQARVLINEIKIVIDTKEIYAYENVKINVNNETDTTETHKREYKGYTEIINNNEYREQIVERAYNALLYWREKYQYYNEFTDIIYAINDLKRKFGERK